MKIFFSYLILAFFDSFDFSNISTENLSNQEVKDVSIFYYWRKIIKYFDNSFQFIKNHEQGS